MKFAFVKITALTALALAGTSLLAACGKDADDSKGSKAEVQAAGLMHASFRVDKMTCASCPITVRKAMKHVPGVRDVKVDFKTKTAEVSYDPALADPAKIAAAATEVGYPTTQITG